MPLTKIICDLKKFSPPKCKNTFAQRHYIGKKTNRLNKSIAKEVIL